MYKWRACARARGGKRVRVEAQNFEARGKGGWNGIV